MPRSFAEPVDWDAVLTFGLMVCLILLTLGSALLFAFHRVLRVAQAQVGEHPGAGQLLLVPGKRLIDGRPDGDFEQRLRCAASLAVRPPRCEILILGGLTGKAHISEAAAGERFLRSLPEGASLLIGREATSRDTLTNLRNVRDMLRRLPADATVTVVSNRYHLARIGLIATSVGIRHRLWPAETAFTPDWTLWYQLLKESVFYLWFLVGKGWATLTRNRRMLERVT
jgi:uncharacterized SAM-binding protein YcdF (DUF218 family)